jgi:hypothetical protein
MRKILLLAIVAAFLVSACGAQLSESDIATIVAGTLQASQPTATTAAPEAGDDLQALTGTVEGSICYPSEGIPPMNLFFLLEGSGQVSVFPVAQNQSTYSVELPAGTYSAFAWLPDYSIGGSYSQAVPCGLAAECSDHSLIQFAVTGGQTVNGVDVCDWYGGEGSVPLPQGVEVPVQPPVVQTGSIAGSLSYPSEFIPAMQIVAFNINTDEWFLLTTAEGSGTYQIDNLPVGSYFIVSYLVGEDYGGGYTAAVPCGLSVDCTDHSLLPIEVIVGQVSSGINPSDWYAPEGTYPQNPN